MGKFKLFLSMAKVGIIGFGGGNALIPVIEKEVVDDKKLISEEEYEEDVLMASITPGALPVEIAGGVGSRVAGWKGAFCGSAGMALPGVFLAVIFMSLMSHINEEVATQINYMTVGITAYIGCLLTDYVVKTMKRAEGGHIYVRSCIIVAVFTLTCGKKLYDFFGIKGNPYIVLSTIHIFLIAFACIIVASFVTKDKRSSEDKGKVSKANNFSKEEFVSMSKELLSFAVLLGLFMIPAAMVADDTLRYVVNSFVSSLLSFGGGDAYLTVADGLFVDTAIISDSAFYGQIVPLVNLLPGSILCKAVSCVGFTIGYGFSGSIIGGYLVAAAGFLCSLLASCGIFIVARFLYRGFGEIRVFSLIKSWIRPIVSGLMITVILSLMSQVKKIGIAENIGMASVIVFVTVYIMNIVMYYKAKMGSLVRVVVSVTMAVLVCNLI